MLASLDALGLHETVLAAAGRLHGGVELCRDPVTLAEAIASPRVRKVCLSLEGLSDSDAGAIGRAIHIRGSTIDVLVHLDLTRSPTYRARVMARHLPSARVSLEGTDSFQDDLLSPLAGRSPRAGAHSRLVPTLLSRFADEAADVVAVGIFAGRRRTSVTAFARAAGIATRTLARWCHPLGTTPERLLGRMLALHSSWLLETTRLSHKQVASECGFSSARAWAKYMERHAGSRPSLLVSRGGFGYLHDGGLFPEQEGSVQYESEIRSQAEVRGI